MPLSAETHLGPYEILALIGKGGMGEVYRARDTKLKRDVALKVLPASFARDPDRMARFQREAEVLASLNHPNIAAIYGIEQSNGVHALIMELVEGESPKGPMPFDEAWHIALQIAAALEYAHDKGVVHRDLKPANIKITPDGVVKLLDFGLAKAFTIKADATPASAANSPEDSPTLTIGATEIGMILGTAAYMPPEQAKGKTVDKRADIWSFGVVLYELLTGERLFKGEDVSETLAQVLTKDPDLGRVPANVRKLISRCLQKDPKKRLRDIGEVAYLLDDVPVTAPSPVRWSWVAWAVAAVAIACAAWLALVHFREQPPPERSLRFQISWPAKVANPASAISPDGRYLLFGPRGAGGPLWVRSLTSLTAQPLAGTEDAYLPFWSPDSKSIGFFTGDKLKRIEINNSGPALSLADVPSARGGTWGNDGSGGNSGGMILFTPTANGPIMRIPAGGGAASPVTKLRPGEVSHRLPWFLPDGRHFFYSATHASYANHNTIHMGDLSSPEDRVIAEADSQALYSRGFLLFLRQDALMAQPFDAQRGIAAGDAVPLEQQIQRPGLPVYADFSASTNGLLAFSAGSAGNSQLTWIDRNGKQLGLLGEPSDINSIRFSPDGKNVAAALGPAGALTNPDIWIYDAVRGLRTRFTFDPAVDIFPVWSPDGRSIIFASNQRPHFDLYRKSADGTGAEEPLYLDSLDKYPTSWSPDGKFLLYNAHGVGAGNNIWVLPLTPERPGAPLKPVPFAQAPFNEISAQFSPDGRWVAYVSGEVQRNEVYVARFPGGGGKRQISLAGGLTPRWRPDGKEIFYLAPDGKIMSASVTFKADALEVGEVKPLFGPVAVAPIGYLYDVSADGQRFLIVPPPLASGEGVTVVQNWTAGLKK